MKRWVSLPMVGTTMATKAITTPTTIIYDRAIGSLRPWPGIMSANLLTSGEMARAKNRAAPRMIKPAAALNNKRPARARPKRTSQNRMKVLVLISSL